MIGARLPCRPRSVMAVGVKCPTRRNTVWEDWVCGSSLGWKQQVFMNPICNCAPSEESEVLQQNDFICYSHLSKFCFHDDKYLPIPHCYNQSLDLLRLTSFSSLAVKVQRDSFFHRVLSELLQKPWITAACVWWFCFGWWLHWTKHSSHCALYLYSRFNLNQVLKNCTFWSMLFCDLHVSLLCPHRRMFISSWQRLISYSHTCPPVQWPRCSAMALETDLCSAISAWAEDRGCPCQEDVTASDPKSARKQLSAERVPIRENVRGWMRNCFMSLTA